MQATRIALLVIGLVFCILSGGVQAQELINECYDLDDGLPPGWDSTIVFDGPGLQEGALWAFHDDGGAELRKVGTPPANTEAIRLEYDANLAYSYWGVINTCRIELSSGVDYCARSEMAEYHNGNVIRVKILRYVNDVVDTTWYWDYPYVDTAGYHFTATFSDGLIEYSASRLDDGTLFFDHFAEDSQLVLSSTEAVAFTVRAKTDNDAWLDNICLRLFTRDCYDFDDNQVPPGWTLVEVLGGPGIVDGALRGNHNDGGAVLYRKAPVQSESNSITFEYDANIAYSLWGLINTCGVGTSGRWALVARCEMAEVHNGNVIKVKVIRYAGDTPDTTWEWDYPYIDSTSYHYSATFSHGRVEYAAERLNDGTPLFDVSVDDPLLTICPVDSVFVTVRAKTDNDAWMDNLCVGTTTGDLCPPCFCPYQSDFDIDGFITSLDLATLIDILFGGVDPTYDPPCPSPRGDFDCDGFTTPLDLGGLIDHLFASGPGPCDPCSP
jgi:hypothetical protein